MLCDVGDIDWGNDPVFDTGQGIDEPFSHFQINNIFDFLKVSKTALRSMLLSPHYGLKS